MKVTVTMVAGVAAAKDDSQGVVGMAPGARLWAVKVLDSTGNGMGSDLIAGVDYVTGQGVIEVVNLSVGGDGTFDALHTAIINSVAAGTTYAVAAGNENQDAGSKFPASYPEVITVSAIVDTDGKCGGTGFGTSAGADDTFAHFSNFGSVVDIAAPGAILDTTGIGGSYVDDFGGTSAATPHVAGAAALYKSINPSASPAQVRTALLNSGTQTQQPVTLCDGNGRGYFNKDSDGSPAQNAEPLLYMQDTIRPTVASTDPVASATNVPVTKWARATFSEPMLSSSITTSTFTLKVSGSSTNVPGVVWLNTEANSMNAYFAPSSNLSPRYYICCYSNNWSERFSWKYYASG